MSNDPFEEFEFRPLTEGLGFQKKPAAEQITQRAEAKDLPVLEMPAIHKSARSTVPAKPPSTDSADRLLDSLKQKRNLDFAPQSKVSLKTEVIEVAGLQSFSAIVLDTMLIVAASLGCLIILMLMTGIDLYGVLVQSGSVLLYLALGSIFFLVHFVYMLANRVFLGFTPGEWVFDQQLGFSSQQRRWNYGPKIIARTLLIQLTGFLVLPVLSWLFKKDLAGVIFQIPIVDRKIS